MIASNAQDWPLEAMAGLLFFGPFIAAEVLPLRSGSLLQKATRILLFSYLLIALLLQALNSTKTFINDGMERERLVHLQEGIGRYEEQRLRMLDRVYARLVRENECVPKSRARKNAIACDTLWRQYEEVLDTPKTYSVDPPSTDAFREALRRRLAWLDKLVQKLPADRRVFEYGVVFDFTVRDHSTMEILVWTAHNYGQARAQILIAQFCRNIMLLVLTIVVGIWYHATAEERRKLLKGAQQSAIDAS